MIAGPLTAALIAAALLTACASASTEGAAAAKTEGAAAAKTGNAVPHSGNPLFGGGYADPEGVFLDGE